MNQNNENQEKYFGRTTVPVPKYQEPRKIENHRIKSLQTQDRQNKIKKNQ